MLQYFVLLLLCLHWKIYSFQYEAYTTSWFTTVHVLIVNPYEHEICLVRALKGRERVRSMAARSGAKAGINGGFWKKDGTPAGALKIEGRWEGKAFPGRGAIGWKDKGKLVLIDQLNMADDFEVIPLYTSPERWKEFDYIVGGSPVLIKNGEVVKDFSPEKTLPSFLLKMHARTAVGIRKNGEWIFIVVEGRFYGLLGGMRMEELADLMLQLGCVMALNLDGGSSSTLIIESELINAHSGISERAVSDAILIF